MLRTAEFWVAVSFVGFLAILVYYKIPALVAKALDERAAAIRKELDEARRLREEAQSLLNDYQKKHRNAGQEAEAITEQARRDAEAYAKENSRRSRRDARKADQTGRGEDRPRGGPGGRRRPRSGRRHRVGRGGKDTARESCGCSRCGPRRRGHSQSQRPAELSGGGTPCHSHHPRPELRRRTGCAHQAVVRHSSPRGWREPAAYTVPALSPSKGGNAYQVEVRRSSPRGGASSTAHVICLSPLKVPAAGNGLCAPTSAVTPLPRVAQTVPARVRAS